MSISSNLSDDNRETLTPLEATQSDESQNSSLKKSLPSRCCFSCFTYCRKKVRNFIVESIKSVFCHLSHWIYQYTLLFMIIPLLIGIILSFGMLYRKNVSGIRQQFGIVGKDSQAIAQHKQLFHGNLKRNQIVQFESSNGKNIMSAPHLSAIWDIHNQILGITLQEVPTNNHNGFLNVKGASIPIYKTVALPNCQLKTYRSIVEEVARIFTCTSGEYENLINYSKMCFKHADNICYSPLGLPFMYDLQSEFGQPINIPIHQNTRSSVSFITGQWVDLDASTILESQRKIVESTRIRIAYQLNDTDEDLYINKIWELNFLNLLKSSSIQEILVKNNINMVYAASRSSEDEVIKTADVIASGNGFIYFVTGIIIILYVIISVAPSTFWPMRAWCMCMGCLASVLGFTTGLGLLYLIGLEHTSTLGATPFFVLGIGLDDVFVLIASFFRMSSIENPKLRFQSTVCESGISITITTLTNLLAFVIGIQNPFLAVRNFCIGTAVSLALGYIYVITFFLSWLAILSRHEACLQLKTLNFKWFFLFKIDFWSHILSSHIMHWRSFEECVSNAQSINTSSEASSRSETPFSESTSSNDASDNLDKGIQNSKMCLQPLSSFHQQKPADCPKSILGHLIKFLLTPACSYFIILLFAGLSSYLFFNITQLKKGLQLNTLTGDDSYLRRYNDKAASSFKDYDNPVEIFFSQPQNWCHHSFQNRVHRFLTEAENHLNVTLVQFSLGDYIRYQATTNPRSQNCLQGLSNWLEEPAKRELSQDFSWKDDTQSALNSTIIRVFYKKGPSGTLPQEDWNDLRSLITKYHDLELKETHPIFFLYEAEDGILLKTVLSMISAAIAVLLVSSLILPTIWGGLLVILILFIIVICVMGCMNLWNLPLNMITMVNLTMCIGFAVDFSVHIIHDFHNTRTAFPQLSYTKISEISLLRMTPPILNGGFSTLLAVTMLSVASSEILRIFFKMSFLMLGFSIVCSLYLLPCLLSIFGRFC